MSILPGLGFGSGQIFAAPQANSGNPAPNPTPQQVGILQNAKCTIGADIKTLFGQYQFPVDSAIGKRSIKGSFEFAQMSNAFFQNCFFAGTLVAGCIETTPQPGEAHSVPAVSTYTITVTNAAHFVLDLGVIYSATGVPFTAVASGPTIGQYSVDSTTGVYTFAAADASAPVWISYTYSNATLGTTLTAGNAAMGFGPVVQLNLIFPYEGGGVGFFFPNARLGKIDLTTKIDDYTMMSTEFEAFAGASNNPFISYQAF